MELFTYLMAKNDNNTSVKKDLFSYLLGKNQSGTYQEFTGTSISANNTKKGKMKVNLLGNTSQSGEPTPDTPIPINVVSGDNEVVVTGKNILEPNITSNTSAGVTCTYTENGWLLNGTCSAEYTYFLIFSKNLTAGTYTINGIAGASNSKFQIVTNIGGTTDYVTTNKKTFTLAGETLVTLRLYVYQAYGTFNNLLLPYQLEKGSTATSYEPYTSTSYPINLPDGMFLGWISTYKDSFFKAINGNSIYDNLDSATKESLTYGEWYLEKKIKKITLDGTDGTASWNSWSVEAVDSSKNRFRRQNWLTDITSNYDIRCNYLGVASNNYTLNTIYRYNTGLGVILDSTSFPDVETFLTWQEQELPVVYYPLATPTYTPITGTLKDELEAVWRANSYKGQTNINQINNDLPFNLDVEIKVGS